MKTDLASAGSKASDLVDSLATVLPSDEDQELAFMASLPEDKIAYLNVTDAETETKSELNVRSSMHEVRIHMHIR